MKKRFWVGLVIISALLVGSNSGCNRQTLQDHIRNLEPDSYGLSEVGNFHYEVQAPNDRRLSVQTWYPVADQDVGDGLLASYPLRGPLSLPAKIALAEAPVAPGTHHLIVFSHGYGAVNTQSVELCETLSSHGFIVASVEHIGNSANDDSLSFDEAAAIRVPDVSLVIDSMFARNQTPDDRFEGRMEAGVGVIGHSFGGMTSIGMGVGWAGAPADPRVRAVFPVSAVIDKDQQATHREGSNAGFSAERLSRMTIPVLFMGGTDDRDVSIVNNALGFERVVNAPLAYQASIRGAGHTHFANICEMGNFLSSIGIGQWLWGVIGASKLKAPYDETCSKGSYPIAEAVRLQNLYAVSFFKFTIAQDDSYGSYLTKAWAAANEPDIEFFNR